MKVELLPKEISALAEKSLTAHDFSSDNVWNKDRMEQPKNDEDYDIIPKKLKLLVPQPKQERKKLLFRHSIFPPRLPRQRSLETNVIVYPLLLMKSNVHQLMLLHSEYFQLALLLQIIQHQVMITFILVPTVLY